MLCPCRGRHFQQYARGAVEGERGSTINRETRLSDHEDRGRMPRSISVLLYVTVVIVLPILRMIPVGVMLGAPFAF